MMYARMCVYIYVYIHTDKCKQISMGIEGTNEYIGMVYRYRIF